MLNGNVKQECWTGMSVNAMQEKWTLQKTMLCIVDHWRCECNRSGDKWPSMTASASDLGLSFGYSSTTQQLSKKENEQYMPNRQQKPMNKTKNQLWLVISAIDSGSERIRIINIIFKLLLLFIVFHLLPKVECSHERKIIFKPYRRQNSGKSWLTIL